MQQNPTIVLGGIVDRLAAVKAQLSNLKAEEAALKQVLIDSGETIVDGEEHRAAISLVAGKTTVDWRAVAEYLKPSRQLVTAHSTAGDDFVVVRVSARKTSA